MKPKFAKRLIFLGALAVIMVVGAVALNSANAASRSNFVVAVQKVPPVMEPMRVNSNVHMRILYNIGETLNQRYEPQSKLWTQKEARFARTFYPAAELRGIL